MHLGSASQYVADKIYPVLHQRDMRRDGTKGSGGFVRHYRPHDDVFLAFDHKRLNA